MPNKKYLTDFIKEVTSLDKCQIVIARRQYLAHPMSELLGTITIAVVFVVWRIANTLKTTLC